MREIMEALAIQAPVLLQGDPDFVFQGLTTDSRRAAPGQLFVPLVGENFDGHEFIGRALAAGASGALLDQARTGIQDGWPRSAAVVQAKDTLEGLGLIAGWWRRGLPAQVLAVSGSMGKSTVKEMAASILEQRYRVHKNKGNFNNLIGLPLTLLAAGPDTEKIVVELGINQLGEMERLAEIARADAALLTNVGPVHLEGLGGLEGVVRAKTELWRRMKPGGTAVVNLDDRFLKDAAAGIPGEKVTFGTAGKSPGADVLLRRVRPAGDGGLNLVLEIEGKACEADLPAVGLFQGLNAAAAAAGAYALGAGLDDICGGLTEFEPIPHRMRLLKGVDGLTLLDDSYNANPGAMEQALATLVQLTPQGGRSLAVLGPMAELGEESGEAHRRLGIYVAGQGLDLLVTMGAFAGVVAEAAREAGLAGVWEADGPKEAARILFDFGRQGDFVLIKGSRVARMEELVSLMSEVRDEL